MTLPDQLSNLPCLCFIDGRLKEDSNQLSFNSLPAAKYKIISFFCVNDFVLLYYSKLAGYLTLKGHVEYLFIVSVLVNSTVLCTLFFFFFRIIFRSN